VECGSYNDYFERLFGAISKETTSVHQLAKHKYKILKLNLLDKKILLFSMGILDLVTLEDLVNSVLNQRIVQSRC